MKKVIFTLSMIFAITAAANAQNFFLGGSVNMTTGVNITRVAGETTVNQTSNSVAFEPRFGYYLSEKLVVGLGLRAGLTNNINRNDPDAVIRTRGYNYAFIPFIRYTYLEYGRFALLSESSIHVGGSGSSVRLADNTTDGPKTFNLGVGIVPVLAFRLTNRIDLETRLDFVGLGYNFERSTTSVGGTETVISSSGLAFGANSNSVFNTGDITVGFIYKF